MAGPSSEAPRDAPSDVLVLVDADGSYYAVPRRVIERYRVPDEHRRAVDSLRRRQLREAFGERGIRIEPGTGADPLDQPSETSPEQPAGTQPSGDPSLPQPMLPPQLRRQPLALGWFSLEQPVEESGAPG